MTKPTDKQWRKLRHRRHGSRAAGGVMRIDLAESLANASIGLIVSWLATWLILGFTASQSILITGMFFGLSTTRAFILRRVFRWLAQ